MPRRWSVVAVAAAAGITAFALTRVIWPDPPGFVPPPRPMLPFFIVLSALECAALGLGVAFLAFGYPPLSRLAQPRALTWAAFLSIVWSLVSWWPHDNLHRVLGQDYGHLIPLEYGFHGTLMLAGAIIALFLVKVAAERGRPIPSL